MSDHGPATAGTVTFYNGKTAIGSESVSSSGVATLTTATLGKGTYVFRVDVGQGFSRPSRAAAALWGSLSGCGGHFGRRVGDARLLTRAARK